MVGAGPYGVVRLLNMDSAILEVQEPRQDLPCAVFPIKPALGFDLRLHAGYEVGIPLRALTGSDDILTVIFRVTPENRKEEAVYFSQRVRVPAVEQDAQGDAAGSRPR